MKKVQIDDRFKAALTSKEFNLVQKVDKYGKRVDKQDTTMQAFYKINETPNKYYDDDGNFKWDQHDSSSSEEEESVEEEEVA